MLAMSLAFPLRAEEKTAVNSPAPSPSVRIDNFTFTPAEITVAPGTAIIWINGDDIPHTVTASNKAFRSKVMTLSRLRSPFCVNRFAHGCYVRSNNSAVSSSGMSSIRSCPQGNSARHQPRSAAIA
jgi:plastocyanin